MISPIYRRTELLLGQPTMENLSSLRVIIFGVGGVGSWCAESLVRSGIVHLTIVDSDCVCVTNINRQLMATSRTVGQVKVNILRNRLLEINPHADICAMQEIYSAENADMFHLENYDYVIDAIDSLQNKADLILHATSLPSVRFFSSMGAALKMDPTRIYVTEFWQVKGCPLAAALRRRFKRRKQFPKRKFKCVFSDELLTNKGVNYSCGTSACLCPKAPVNPKTETDPTSAESTSTAVNPNLINHEWCSQKAQINGTVAHITAIFGFMLAGLVLEDAIKTP